jgi:hypothetical protein
MPIDIPELQPHSLVTTISVISNEHIVITVNTAEEATNLKRSIQEITSKPEHNSLWNSPQRHQNDNCVTITGKCDAALLSLVTLRAISLRTYRQCLRAFKSLTAVHDESDFKTSLAPQSPNFY